MAPYDLSPKSSQFAARSKLLLVACSAFFACTSVKPMAVRCARASFEGPPCCFVDPPFPHPSLTPCPGPLPSAAVLHSWAAMLCRCVSLRSSVIVALASVHCCCMSVSSVGLAASRFSTAVGLSSSPNDSLHAPYTRAPAVTPLSSPDKAATLLQRGRIV